MRSAPTLKRRVLEITTGAFIMAAALTAAAWFAFSYFKSETRGQESEQLLLQSSTQQVEQLIPSFLLPEQRDGADLFLRKIKKLEGLTEAKIVSSTRDVPGNFSSCSLLSHEVSFCLSNDASQIAAIIPVNESNITLGHIFKARTITKELSDRDYRQFVGIFALILSLTLVVTYSFVARVFSRRVTSALDELVDWIEADLNDQPARIRQLPFHEFENLKDRIASVMDRHAATRDQAVVGQLTSGIMHDIRTPLQSVITALHLLEKEGETSTRRMARLENLASMCRSNLPILGQIIESTLDGSRRVVVSPKATDLANSVRSGVALCEGLISLRKANVDVLVGEQPSVAHDPVQLARVIQNLVKNSIEATPDGNPKVSILIERSLLGVVVRVDDNGSGLQGTPERAFRVFKSSKVRGNGLGLHISKKIIEAHGGQILASNESSLGGARFEIFLPHKALVKFEQKGEHHEATA